MCEETKRERDIAEKFDRFIKREIFNASNEYRKEKGLPLITEEEAEQAAKDGGDANE